MYENVLIPTDGSPGTDGLVARALDLARVADATVHTLFVIPQTDGDRFSPTERKDYRDAMEAHGRTATGEIAERASSDGLDAVREIREGRPHEAILDYAREQGIDLIVMGTHGRTGAERARLGSTTERVITYGEIPVLSVPLRTEPLDVPSGRGSYDHVVIPTDGSEFATRAAEHGLTIADEYESDVHVVYVVDEATYNLNDAPRSIVGLLKDGGQRAMDDIATQARERDLAFETDVLRGTPEDEILDFADGVGADLVVLGTRGRAATTDQLLGSTTARVIERAGMPVLAVS
jgi:nucleotide-binding universal stress UspA family protein